ncbi:MAG: PEP-CTERM sorting domain-containing protein [Opitutaceae bacterium]|nr:PEP-CTERM sorting domain-containing protein [Opitutaceae bacterium]
MKLRDVRLALWAGLCWGISLTPLGAQVFVWTGVGNGWYEQLTPPNDGTAVLQFGPALRTDVVLTGSLDVDAIVFGDDENYTVNAPSPFTLTLRSGLSSVGADLNRLSFGANLDLSLVGTPVLNSSSKAIIISGRLTGSPTQVTLTGASNGAFIFNNPGAGNTYTGPTIVGSALGTPTVAFWNSSPFGSGNVSFYGGGTLVAHNTVTLANNLTVNTNVAGGTLFFRSWDNPLTLSGAITLANNATFAIQPVGQNVVSADNSGSYPLPGSFIRHPVVITGTIGESGGARVLTVNGQSTLILQPAAGTNTYTGGTVVNGSLIFGNNNAIPTGSQNVTVNATGYVGFGDVSSGNFATQLAHINLASAGAVGVDTLPGGPTVTYGDPINLNAFTNTSVRIGTATSAILTGSIIPEGPNYQFGNGGGTLYVSTNLGNVTDPTANPTGQASALTVGGNGLALRLLLQGTNTYAGGTTVTNGVLVFDSATAIPATGQLIAGGAAATIGSSYVGYTDIVTLGSAFTTRFNAASTWGIIGFDTHATNPTATISGVNLTGFNDGVFLGTSTSAILTGTLTPSTVANPTYVPAAPDLNYAPNTLRFTATHSGVLTVNSNLTGSTAVVLGSPTNLHVYSSGTVILGGTNSYSGGTLINPTPGGLTVAVASNGALGTGPVSVGPGNGGSRAGLQATVAGLDLANAISFLAVPVGTAAQALHFTGTNPFTLSGQISGAGNLELINPSPLTVTLAGDNIGFSGMLDVFNGTLNLAHNRATGTGTLAFNSPAATVAFTGPATAPVVHGISGDAGSLVVPNGTVLAFDLGNSLIHDFAGVISGAGGAATTAALIVDSTNPAGDNSLYLSGANTYSGGTTITNYGILALGHDQAAGSGAVTLNAPNGGLVLNTGVTFTNDLIFTAGTLAGFGTFDPSNLPVITIGTNQRVLPGYPADLPRTTGILTFAFNTAFANGGVYEWNLQEPDSSEGFSQLLINGNLDLTSLSLSGFTIKISTYDGNGDLGLANLVAGTSYTMPILQTSGTIAGFDPARFTFDTTDFQNGAYPLTNFSLSTDLGSQILYLTFTPVPEPSTWALLLSGSAALAVAARRRARRGGGPRA